MPSQSLSIVVIGAGPVATTLAVRCRALGHRIVAVVSHTTGSAHRLARRVGCRIYGSRLQLLSPSVRLEKVDLVIVSVPDRALHAVGASLAASIAWDRSTSFVHTSGALTTDCFSALKAIGHRVASLHPIQSFPRLSSVRPASADLEGIWWGVECAAREIRWAHRLVRSWGGRPFQVPKEMKIAYHLACTFAANYSVLMWLQAAELGRVARVPRGLEPFLPLIRSTLNHTVRIGSKRALTGPAVRGDREILRSHRDVLRRRSPEWLRLFDELVNRAGSLSRKRRARTRR